MTVLPDWLQSRVDQYKKIQEQMGLRSDVMRDAGKRTPNAHRVRSSLQCRRAKSDATNRSIIGIAYPAWDPIPANKGKVTLQEVERFVDSYGTFMRRSTVRTLAQRFLANGRSVDADHSRVPGAALVGESFIVQEGDVRFPDHAGSWAVAPLITRDDVWARVEAADRGEPTGLNGFSIDVVTSFRNFDVDIDGVGVVTLGEFIDPEPLYLSLVPFPSTKETLRAGQRQTPPDSVPIIRCEEVGENMPNANDIEVTEEEMGVLSRILRSLQRDPAKVQRAIAVQRAVDSLLNKAESVDLKKEAYALADLLWSYLWEVFDDADLDMDGKRKAILQGFADLAKVAKDRLSEDAFSSVVRADADGFRSLAGLLETAVSRAGKKISKGRMEKIQQALDLLKNVVDEASDAESEDESDSSNEKQRAQKTGVTPGVTAPNGVQRDERTELTDQETNMEKQQVDEILGAIRGIDGKVGALETEIAKIKGSRAGEAHDGSEGPADNVVDPVAQIRESIDAFGKRLDGLAADVNQLRGSTTQRRGTAGDGTEGPIQNAGTQTVVTRTNGQKVDMSGIF